MKFLAVTDLFNIPILSVILIIRIAQIQTKKQQVSQMFFLYDLFFNYKQLKQIETLILQSHSQDQKSDLKRTDDWSALFWYFLEMSSRIRKIFFFSNKDAVLFYNCDLPLGYRILQNSQQRMGQLTCILTQSGLVYESPLKSNPHLNPMQEWNQKYFKKLFYSMDKFILTQKQDKQDYQQDQNDKKSKNSKILLVADLTNTHQEINLLRVQLIQGQFHKGKTGTDRLWEEYQKYLRYRRWQENQNQKNHEDLLSKKNSGFKKINQLITKQDTKKNQIRERLTHLYKQKRNKYEELNKLKTNNLDELVDNFGRYSEESSSMNISDVQFLNSQEDRPLVGSMFQPSQDYFCKENKILQE